MFNNVKQTTYSKLAKHFFVVLGIFLFILIVFGLISEYIKEKELDNSINSLEDELVQLKLNKKNFLDSISNYEQEARDKFNLKRPGEDVYIIDVVDADGEVINNENVADKSVQLNIVSWWNYFFGVK